MYTSSGLLLQHVIHFGGFFSGEAPGFFRAMVIERDIFLAHSLRMAAETYCQHNYDPTSPNGRVTDDPPVVVGVVGIGHVMGIGELFETVTLQDVCEVVKIPKPTRVQVWTGTVIRFGVLVGTIYGAYRVTKKILNR